MTNILLNINNFGDNFAYRKLKKIIKPYHRVLIIPFSYHEDYVQNADDFDEHFSKGAREIEEIIREFGCYGVKRKNVRILHSYNDSEQTIQNKFAHSDILFFMGGYPKKALERIDNLNIRENIQNFRGIVMGTSAGAMIQLDEFHITPEEESEEYQYCLNGLGLISGFDIEVHFKEDFLHLSGMITDLKLHDKTIYAMPNNSGLIVRNNKITILGDVVSFNRGDIDTLQFVLDTIVENCVN